MDYTGRLGDRDDQPIPPVASPEWKPAVVPKLCALYGQYLLHRPLAMTSGTPTSQPEDQTRTGAAPSVLVSWRRRWLEPVVVATIVIALVSTLIMGWMTMFQSLKEDIHSSEAGLMEAVKLAEIRNDTQIHEVKGDLAELKEDARNMGDKLDRVLEALLVARI